MLEDQDTLTTETQEATSSLSPEMPASEAQAPLEAAPESKPEHAEEQKPLPTAPVRTLPFIALPISTSQLLKKKGCTHPGLQAGAHASLLTMVNRKLEFDSNPEQLKKIWQKTAHTLNNTPELKQEWETQKQKRQTVLTALNARVFTLQTQSSLWVETRQALGQTGLDLHPLYGFPYLPSARLKGLIRRYAETHWLPQQANQAEAQAQIQSLLGHPTRKGGDSGSLVIHDAWPENWPNVQTDLSACHHRPYYQRRDAAGDWQTPDPRYFLSLRGGARFSFALSSHRPDQTEHVELAETWLKEALSVVGYGSGSASGYGLMKAAGSTPSEAQGTQFSTQLSLNTPGFYRGSSARSEDCQLRPSSLRGLLRWWWRSLHSGFLPQRSLLLLENALWGNRGKKAAIRLEIVPTGPSQARRFHEHDLVRQLPAPDHPKTKPGLSYLTYGTGEHQERAYYLAAGTQWQIKLSCDTAYLLGNAEKHKLQIPAEMVLEQAKAALWLLSHYGGSGQRMRKGLGNFQTPIELNESLNHWLENAEQLREHCGFNTQFQEEQCETPSLVQRIEPEELLTPWKNEWFALHQLGIAYQSFMQKHKHQALKQGLGLPRMIGEPVQGEFTALAPVKERHASPLFMHFSRQAETNRLILRLVAFPSKHLPDTASSQKLLEEFCQHILHEMRQQIETWPLEPELRLNLDERRSPSGRKDLRPARRPSFTKPSGESGESSENRPPRREFKPRLPRAEGSEAAPRRFARPERSDDKPFRPRKDMPLKPTRPAAPKPLQAGDRVEATLLEERTKKGGWKALHGKSKLSGPIVNSGLVPGESGVGDAITLIVHSVNRFEMAFRVPTAADDAAEKGKKKKVRSES
ncbi:hypothetical protein COW36_13775 [bacterium (Candidatus Blackallbacteria) CG17_big_fil_post_rev_8_21_14_2_50_48_46]|uniref:CRISPR type III-associated protein domain-containing protein n=1 Tax=bacterium (Candidatus Blackallbacteria) CG17_big_fil_post_rev_8_21_14_2_50_48_46 TaxID=2014261 RepID=A0A2M7G3C2_9BACT|nr:MAG: hypothetical protein COW64_23250 [bacterium (Candidatus Blackallbacteria) CG18_big_fil_WC_8_21_14_2_50_49_26]PIW16197.1 MAG: hypothetical protein COW36_13775 [bacterium (Candidatus Blackallbacteria) CG17_big_fil_post_rev_8_21_14_2_50_48_46]PIW49920.1 MAG: hypothetical protein COW20_04530 [bacterium (Candidatus Blackallbacteria) CG13_big_fil_rev_8_21_14_2_50_49_14]